ncbi:hypothetical protein [Pasteurella testudinis]|uniref:hypothetical protein n=1 Tax=Pasteurella testudinis TaxID=761 RepID=UPI0040586300
MAFTEKTFSRLRESVRQSMLEDKQNNLNTGEVIEISQANDYGILYEISKAMRHFSLSSEADNRVTRCLTNDIVKDGEIFVDVIDPTGVIKPRKNMKVGKALRYLCAEHELSSDRLKSIVNSVKQNTTQRWIMFTDRDIHTHYRVIAVKQNTTSCMSKKPEFYGRIRPGTEEGDPTWVRYIYPTEAYNHSPNLRLALLTDKDPNSKEFDDGYPFIARAIVNIDTYPPVFARAYGVENADNYFNRELNHSCGIDGGLLCIVRDEDGEIVAPYVDPDNRLDVKGEYLRISDTGEYEVMHSSGELDRVCECYCNHCNEYRDSCDENDYIYVEGLGEVYGCCQHEYAKPYRWESYYLIDDLYWSDHHDMFLHPDDALDVITSVSMRGDPKEDYIHECELGYTVVELQTEYGGIQYALKDLCVETVDDKWFLAAEQVELYTEYNDYYYDVEDCSYSDYQCTLIPDNIAIRTPDGEDWIDVNNLDQWKKDNDYVEITE